METNQNKSGLKIMVAVLALLLLASLGYMYKMHTEMDTTEQKLDKTLTEKEAVIADLESLKTQYDTEIEANTTLKEELQLEKEKVQDLINKIKNSVGDPAALAKFKNDYLKLKREMDVLVDLNEQLNTTVDSTNTVLAETKTYVDTLANQNQKLAKTIEKGSKLSVLNLNVTPLKVKGSGKEVQTDKASRINRLKISFTIAENQIAKSGDKSYYVQVIDSKNNVLGEKKSVMFGDKLLNFSFISKVKYENKTIQVTEELNGDNFEKGTYFVHVFDKSELVSKSSFELR